MQSLLPLASSLLSFVFAAMVLDQWWQRRRAFQLVWGIGLIWYGIATGTEFLGPTFGWSEPLYRTWYQIGAFLVPSYLGAGTLYLLQKTRFGYLVAASIALGGLFSLAATAKSPGCATGGYGALEVALLVAAWRSERAVPGQAQLTGARHDPDRPRGAHSRGHEQPQPLRGDVVFLPGRVPRAGPHLCRLPGQRRGVSQRAHRDHHLVSRALGVTRK